MFAAKEAEELEFQGYFFSEKTTNCEILQATNS